MQRSVVRGRSAPFLSVSMTRLVSEELRGMLMALDGAGCSSVAPPPPRLGDWSWLAERCRRDPSPSRDPSTASANKHKQCSQHQTTAIIVSCTKVIASRERHSTDLLCKSLFYRNVVKLKCI